MNIAEARKVFWLKSNYRPLGELLDEGYLTKDRLEWAAKWAYNPNLQQASKVILEALNRDSAISKGQEPPKSLDVKTKDTGINVGISLEKARCVAWPFAPYRGQPMGALIEGNLLSLKDLAYAVENAWDEKVRQAATTFSLIKLNQIVKEPTRSAGFVRVVSGGRSYSEREQLRLTLLEGLLVGCVFTLWLIFAIWMLFNSFKPNPNAKSLAQLISSPAGIIALIFVLVVFLLIAWLVTSIPEWITKRFERRIEHHRRGQEGEEKVVQTIVQALDGNWHVFRNLNLPGRKKGDLDLVLVGPPGVWALEVKNFKGEYRNIGENWEYKYRKNWKSLSKSPSQQAYKNMYGLKDFLKADNVNVFVNSAVIWANTEGRLIVENPSVAVWPYNRLPDELGNIWQAEKLSQAERNKIIEKLTKLCEQQKRASQ